MECQNPEIMEISWTSHPAILYKKKTIFSGIIILFFGYIVFISFQSLYWSIFSVIILIFSLKQFYFPVHYSVSNKGIKKKYILGEIFRDWSEVKRFSKNKRGGILYRRSEKSFLDHFTGLELQFENNADNVIRTIESKMAAK